MTMHPSNDETVPAAAGPATPTPSGRPDELACNGRPVKHGDPLIVLTADSEGQTFRRARCVSITRDVSAGPSQPLVYCSDGLCRQPQDVYLDDERGRQELRVRLMNHATYHRLLGEAAHRQADRLGL